MSSQVQDSSAALDVSRRGFVVTSLAAGFALAAQPVSAQKIETNTEGLEAGEVKIPVADGTVPAYRAMPAGGAGPFPVVLVVQEIFGVHEHIKDICRRFAKLGYYAIAPELYARQGGMRSAFAQFRSIRQDADDNKASLTDKLTMPVLAIGGAKSFGPNEAIVMRDAASHVTELVVPNAGHWLMEEATNVTVSAVRSFVDGKPVVGAKAE